MLRLCTRQNTLTDAVMRVRFIAEKNRDFMVFVDAVKGKDWGQLGVEVVNKCVTEGTGTTPYQLEWS